MTDPKFDYSLTILAARLWLGAKFGALLALLMLTLLLTYQLLTAPSGTYFGDHGVQWHAIGDYLLTWGLPLLTLNMVLGALHYCRAAHDKKHERPD
ncbi:hypothetical protein [uncultured Ferrimonas sp.]|uniref:hypothetical protein n=1 Tax=uncultured Ferrimonas sp. TaxID=432640 RepID=UPI002610D92A|nr:hypothetical protein [uncultured Ferrimonas sp.]